ncbi:hypothetical protein CBS101457_006237 [Exobasidium rhododendri]|nr:hypothetical protein CBS101457_006237 [Exobasidium rhododendri]
MSSSPKVAGGSPTAELAKLSLDRTGRTPSSGGSGEEAVEASGDGINATVLTLRALVSTKEAGVIIGKGGSNVAELREKSGVKAGVSKVIPGVHDRVLSVSGSLDNVAKAFGLIAATILENPLTPGAITPASGASTAGQTTTIRLLISHNLMGTVIGRQGLKIKHIQDTSGVRMVASKEMLPSSTERSVEVQGTVQGIETAVAEIGRCLLEDWERGQGTILYHPGLDTVGAGVLAAGGEGGLLPQGGRRISTAMGAPSTLLLGANVRRGAPTLNHPNPLPVNSSGTTTSSAAAVNPGGSLVTPTINGATIPAQVVDGDLRVQNISIPSDMVGCIIGKGGSKITEIRRISGSRISIAKVPHDESGERMFTIQGSAESNEKALFLLYNSLEGEKERRASAAASQVNGDGTANGVVDQTSIA